MALLNSNIPSFKALVKNCQTTWANLKWTGTYLQLKTTQIAG